MAYEAEGLAHYHASLNRSGPAEIFAKSGVGLRQTEIAGLLRNILKASDATIHARNFNNQSTQDLTLPTTHFNPCRIPCDRTITIKLDPSRELTTVEDENARR